MKSAIFFGIIYAGVLLTTAFAEDRFGDRGLYMVAGLSGLTDVDAITLSTSQMVNLNRVSADQGWRLIVVATMSNLLFKTATVAMLGDRKLFKRVSLCFGLALLIGAGILFFWHHTE